MKLLSFKMLYWGTVGLVFFLSAEVTSRVTDWAQAGVPLLATPNQDRDLILRDGPISRGRPHGRYKKWQLNAYGFRGREIAVHPQKDCIRVMVLGASESFGLYESVNHEYPAQLATLLGSHRCFEVINGAIVGMTVHSMIPYWRRWGSQFQPDVVVIYPSPLFYLNFTTRPKLPSGPDNPLPVHPTSPPPSLPFQFGLRLFSDLQDYVEIPNALQRYRDQYTLRSKTRGQPAQWFFHELPTDQLQWFVEDLCALTRDVVSQGAQPILVTHAFRIKPPLETQDLQDLERARVHTPRALPQVIAAFERAAVEQTLTLVQQYHWPVVHAAEVMNGHKEYFGDLVHFSDDGARTIAALIAERIVSLNLSHSLLE